MKALIFSILLGLAFASPPHEPRFTVEAPKARSGIPNIKVTFPNGHEDSLILERYYTSPEHRMTGELHCNYIGHLNNEATACVAVTGCYGQEDLHFTINSKHNTLTNMYILEKNGNLKPVENVFNDKVVGGAINLSNGEREIETGFDQNGDEMVNSEVMAEEFKFEKLCASGDCSTIPDKNLMKIKIGYEDTWIQSFGGDTSASTSYINSMLAHVQAFFCLDSLGTKIQVETTGDYTYHQGYTWTADGNDLGNEMRPLTAASTADANLWVYLSKHENFGYVGLAYVGVLCASKQYSCSINEKLSNVLSTAQVVTHEIGHNLGMNHDFADVHGGQSGPCNGQGFMSYGSAPNQWSTCSKNDFLAHYNAIVSSSNLYWCLPYADSACGSSPSPSPPSPSPSPSPPSPSPSPPSPPSPTTTTTTTTTTTPSPSACGSPQWFGDNYCDDDNNNEACGWDGGDCCGSNVNTQYCSVCECLDPDFTSDCQDKWKTKKCIRRKNKGKCNKKRVKKNCQKTCGFC